MKPFQVMEDGQVAAPLAVLTRVLTYKRWTQVAERDFGFFGPDIPHLAGILCGHEMEGYFTRRLAGLSRRTLRYRSRSGRHVIVTSVGHGQFLTRSCKPSSPNGITFAVAAEISGHMRALFEWQPQAAGPFEHFLSACSQYVLLCGPCDAQDAKHRVPSTKLVAREGTHSFHSYHLKLSLPDVGGTHKRVWPVAAAFHPSQEALCFMICSPVQSTHLPRDKPNGYLAVYDVHMKHFIEVASAEVVSAAMLRPICGGQRVVVADPEGPFPACRCLLVFATCGLLPLHRVPVLPTCALTNATFLYTPDFRRLALMLSRRRLRPDPALEEGLEGQSLSDRQVAVYAVRLAPRDISLSRLACSAICTHVHSSQLHALPLPSALLDMLQEHAQRT